MRLHRLAVEAFGPFARRVEIDIDSLGESGLFLIHGPTGSGKTSLLDAICYALYGTVPGARQEARTLASHHAAPTTVPTVELELTAAGRRFQIIRSPEFERPKKRGTGTTRTPAKVLMTELVDGTWQDRGNGRHADVADILGDVIGLDARQFQTVVLLPQGEFARFLRADTSERVAVLSRLFDTARFDDITRWLEQQRRRCDADAAEGRSRLRLALVRAADALESLPLRAPSTVTQETLELFSTLGATGTDGADPAAPRPSARARAVAAADTPAMTIDVDAVSRDDVESMLADAGRYVDGVLSVAAEQAAAGTTALATARRAREHGEATARMRENAARAQAENAALDAAETAIADARRRLEASSRAAAVSGYLAAACAARTEQHAADERRQSLPENLRAEDAARDLEAALGEQAETLSRLDSLGRQGDEAANDLADARQRTQAARTAVTRAVQRVDDRAAAHQSAAAEHERTAARAALEPAARSLVEALETCLHAHRAVQDADGELDESQRALATAEQAAARAQREAARLGRARADGLAAELAARLLPDEPCPVCGSAEHPRPAAVDGPTVSPDDVAAAEEALATCRDVVATTTAAVGAATARRTERHGRLADAVRRVRRLSPTTNDTDTDDTDQEAYDDEQTVGTRLADARAGHRATQEAGAALDDLAHTVTERARAHEAAERELAAAREAVAGLDARQQALEQRLDAALEALAAEAEQHADCPCGAAQDDLQVALAGRRQQQSSRTTVDGPVAPKIGPTVTAVVEAHRRAHTAAGAALRVHEDHARATEQRRTAQRRLTDALAEHRLPDEATATAALVDDQERARLERLVTTHDERRTRARAILEQEDVIAALAAAEPDIDVLLAAERRASEKAEQATETQTLARRAAAALRHAAEHADTVLDELGPALVRADVVRELADTAAGSGGNNALRMSLTTFVLAARLEEVVRLANERLGIMTAGRYELRHSDALAARGKRSGLGLEVVDAWSGTARDTKTLSGGETFMTSLALALALGDAVRGESGGLALETLFVDEGFGTLDDEALEQVVDVLDGLRAGGRSVGIVSHVSELRQRIPAQVKLTRTPTGSGLTVLTEPEVV